MPATQFLFLAVCALVVIIPLAARISRALRKKRERDEAELLREYPELAEIISSQKGR
jgi:2-oxo-4-hydroxy-4-carboxy--5-ureidoimidazoline (OHCU) decarboxylase